MEKDTGLPPITRVTGRHHHFRQPQIHLLNSQEPLLEAAVRRGDIWKAQEG